MTPEGRVKHKVKQVLKLIGELEPIYTDMPVPGGYGKSGLDFNIGIRGRWIAVETKAPGGEPTPRQRGTMVKMHRAGIRVFVVSNDEGLEALRQYLMKIVRLFPSDEG